MGVDACACCCSVLCCIVALPLALYAAPKFIEKTPLYEQPIFDEGGHLRTPANLSKTMWYPECVSDDFKEAFGAFNKEHDWKLVTYQSKPGDDGQEIVNLTAWWLPVKDAEAPRVVVQHGNNVNFNDWTVQIAGWYLRSMGFAVLMPNLRDHGSSGKTSHGRISWSWEYYLDVQAAWDYAVNDPEGKLGGKLDKSKVGIMGLSMGGLASSTAFGLEKDAPALWLDSAVFNPKETFQSHLAGAAGGFLAWVAIEPAWIVAAKQTGVDIDGVLPSEVLVKGSSRKVAVVHEKADTKVPFSQANRYLDQFKKEDFKVMETYLPDSSPCEGAGNHVQMHVAVPKLYYGKLCKFWSNVFGTSADACNAMPKVLEEKEPMEAKAPTRLYALGAFGRRVHSSVPSAPFAAVMAFAGVAGLAGARAFRLFVRRQRSRDFELARPFDVEDASAGPLVDAQVANALE